MKALYYSYDVREMDWRPTFYCEKIPGREGLHESSICPGGMVNEPNGRGAKIEKEAALFQAFSRFLLFDVEQHID